MECKAKEKARKIVEEEILPGYRKQFGDEIYFNLFTRAEVDNLINRIAEYEKNKGKPIPIKSDVDLEFKTCDYDHLLAVLNQYDHGYDIAGGVEREAIDKAEKLSGYKLPESFKNYLAVFGSITSGDSYHAGITDPQKVEELFWITKTCQDEHGLPDGYLCLTYDSYLRYTTCIDLQSGLGDSAPTLWYLFDDKRFDGIESVNFDIYFRNEIASTIKYNREKSTIQ